ncbi:MAG: quinate 5-dehydrogenase [Bacillota bacterium]
MKKIVSVSIGASSRDKSVETEILGEKYHIQRIGTDGDINKAIRIIRDLDGKVDAFGMGGIDIYLTALEGRRYVIKDAIPIKEAAKNTPLVDGTGIKNTLEYKVINYLKDNNIIDLKGRKALITCAADRFKMAQALINSKCDVVLGDFIFALGIPLPIKNIDMFRLILRTAMPVISRIPFKVLYPTGDKQSKINHERFSKYYNNADIIAGDFHYIKKYMPQNMKGKVIITNTVTSSDVEMLGKRGVSILVTTTPDLDGRSFGTNVIEAILVSISGKDPSYLTEEEYYLILDRLDIKPRIEYLN